MKMEIFKKFLDYLTQFNPVSKVYWCEDEIIFSIADYENDVVIISLKAPFKCDDRYFCFFDELKKFLDNTKVSEVHFKLEVSSGLFEHKTAPAIIADGIFNFQRISDTDLEYLNFILQQSSCVDVNLLDAFKKLRRIKEKEMNLTRYFFISNDDGKIGFWRSDGYALCWLGTDIDVSSSLNKNVVLAIPIGAVKFVLDFAKKFSVMSIAQVCKDYAKLNFELDDGLTGSIKIGLANNEAKFSDPIHWEDVRKKSDAYISFTFPDVFLLKKVAQKYVKKFKVRKDDLHIGTIFIDGSMKFFLYSIFDDGPVAFVAESKNVSISNMDKIPEEIILVFQPFRWDFLDRMISQGDSFKCLKGTNSTFESGINILEDHTPFEFEDFDRKKVCFIMPREEAWIYAFTDREEAGIYASTDREIDMTEITEIIKEGLDNSLTKKEV